MNWLATLHRSGGVNALARHLCAPTPTVMAGVAALLPPLLDAMRGFGGGATALMALIEGQGGGELAARIMRPTLLRAEAGEALRARLFPGGVMAHTSAAARMSGADPALLDRLAPPLAMLVAGYIAAKAVDGDPAVATALLAASPIDEDADFDQRKSGE